MSEKENVKKLSLWQRGKLWYSLKFKGIIPEDCQFGAIDALSVKQVDKFRYKILSLSDENLHPLFTKENSEKLRTLCQYSGICTNVKDYLERAGSPDEIRAFLLVTPEISLDWAEKYFIGHNPEEFFKPYLEAHDNMLPDEVVDFLIQHEQEELLLIYISLFKEDEYHNISEHLLFGSKMEKAKQTFAEKFVCDHGNEDTIFYILEYGNDELVTKLLHNCYLSSDESFALLFNRENPALIDLVFDKSLSGSRHFPTIVVNTLLESSYQNQILKYLEHYQLNDDEEFSLVIGNNSEAILFYLKKNNKPFYDVQTENYLFEHASDEVLDYYRQNIRLPYAEERALIKNSTSKEILAYLEKHDLFDMNGLLLIETGTYETIKCLIEKYEISSASEVALMRRNIPELTQLYFDKLAQFEKCLSDIAEATFVTNAQAEVVSKYFQFSHFKLSDEAQKALLYRGDKEILREFCNGSCGFQEDIVEDFLKHAPQQLILSYLEDDFFFPDTAMVALVKRRDAKLLQTCFAKGIDLCEEAEIALLNSKNIEFIKAYLTEERNSRCVQSLYEKTEALLLNLHNDDLFMLYIKQSPLFNNNEVKLVRECNQTWLDAYIAKYDLSSDASRALAQKLYAKI